MFITQLAEAENNTRWEKENEELKIHEEGWPGCRLMFRNGCDDRDVSVNGFNKDYSGR